MENPKIMAIIGTTIIIGAFWGMAHISPPKFNNTVQEYRYFDQVDESQLSISGIDDLKRFIPQSFIRALRMFKKNKEQQKAVVVQKADIAARLLLAAKAQSKVKGGSLTLPGRFEYRQTNNKGMKASGTAKSNRFNSSPSNSSQNLAAGTVNSSGFNLAGKLNSANKDAVDSTALTALEWFDMLNETPNPRRLNEFLNLSLQRKITPEIYYRVVELLSDSEQSHSRKYAAQILTAIPTAKNFLGLIELERKYDRDTASLKAVYAAYSVYSRSLLYVNPLMTVLESSDDVTALVTAMRLLSDSAKRSILTQGPTQSGEEPTAFADISTQQTFTQVLELAEQLASHSPDRRVKDRASELADTLSKYISSTGVAAAEISGR